MHGSDFVGAQFITRSRTPSPDKSGSYKGREVPQNYVQVGFVGAQLVARSAIIPPPLISELTLQAPDLGAIQPTPSG
ncbi:hypothetical protein GA0071314_2572 [Halomonas sp. HL-93]|nr:hypothetical protein GA0071314_2572 [Halomonas sp. HL-93]